jgi:hypothetical protein
MDSVVHGFVPDESPHHSKEEKGSRMEAGKHNQRKGYGEQRQPGTGRKHGVRVAVVYVVEWADEGLKTMA